MYIPYFLCDSVSTLCEKNGFSYEYYYISKDFYPIFDFKLNKDEYLYVVNYYGQISNSDIIKLQKKYKNVILDNVQAFFQKNVPGIDTIYSCRKFFGVPDGAYLATSSVLSDEISIDVSKDRMKHILGRFEGAAYEYYSDFRNSDEMFENLELRSMSKLTHNLLGAIDYSKAKRRREKNFMELHNKLGAFNKLQLKKPKGPYAYPFYCKNGMEVKKKLAEKKIYVATLWPNVLSMDDGIEKDYAENILPLPCDQRYNKTDMQYLIEVLHECLKM